MKHKIALLFTLVASFSITANLDAKDKNEGSRKILNNPGPTAFCATVIIGGILLYVYRSVISFKNNTVNNDTNRECDKKNTINGYLNYVSGKNNTINGSFNYVAGNNNTINGNYVFVSGNRNTVNDSFRIIHGDRGTYN